MSVELSLRPPRNIKIQIPPTLKTSILFPSPFHFPEKINFSVNFLSTVSFFLTMAPNFDNRRFVLALRIFLLLSLFFNLSPTFAQVNFASFVLRDFFHDSCMHRGLNVFDFYVQDSLVQNAKEDSGGSVDLGRRAKVSIRCIFVVSFDSIGLLIELN